MIQGWRSLAKCLRRYNFCWVVCRRISWWEKESKVEANDRLAKPFPFSPTLGDLSTTSSHPASSSHRVLAVEERAAIAIDEGFFRLSVGIEDPDYIISCVMSGIAAARQAT